MTVLALLSLLPDDSKQFQALGPVLNVQTLRNLKTTGQLFEDILSVAVIPSDLPPVDLLK